MSTLTAYKSYRLLMNVNQSGAGTGYYAVDDWKLFTGQGGQGTNVLTGGTASASSTFGESYVAAQAFDNDDSTAWVSQVAPPGTWLRYDLAAAVTVKSMRLKRTIWPHDAPRDFILQGSNDNGTTWTDIRNYTYFWQDVSPQIKVVNFDLFFGGIAKNDDGTSVTKVRIYDYATGILQSEIYPESNGSWSWRPPIYKEYFIVYLSRAGYRPEIDGPLYPFVL